MKRWDRYSASYTTQDDKKSKKNSQTYLQTADGTQNRDQRVISRHSRNPDESYTNVPRLNLSKNLPPLPPSSCWTTTNTKSIYSLPLPSRISQSTQSLGSNAPLELFTQAENHSGINSMTAYTKHIHSLQQGK